MPFNDVAAYMKECVPDMKEGKAKKVKHPHLKALRSKLGSISRGKDRDGSGSTQTASPTSEQVAPHPKLCPS